VTRALARAPSGDTAPPAETPRRGWTKPPRLYEEVARDLAEAIGEGRFAEGDFLPTEQVLAADYGASRTVIREALKLVSARGLVEVLHGRGTRVRPRQRWQLQDQLIALIREDRQIPGDLVELRRVIEGEVAALAATRATDEHVAALRATIEAMRDAGRPDLCVEQDIRFHELLAEASGNALVPLVLEPLGQLARASRLATIRVPGAIGRSADAHLEIFRQIEARCAEGARQAMHRHLTQIDGELGRARRQ
jgi:GntR family transcriptional repressor for pyruvate dehydrogenase complex